MKILVMSCDKYAKYTFNLFHHCIEKYWPKHPEVVYCTETVINPYYRTININYPINKWSQRLYETLKQINDDVVLVCPDDTFFRKSVNASVINKLCSYIDNKLIAINLEPPFEGTKVNEILCLRTNNSRWLTSMMPQLWNKKKLEELLFNVNCSPRETEHLGYNSQYNFGIIATENTDIDFGKIKNVYPYAIVEGKWAREIVSFCEKENVQINFNELGFFD